CSLPCLSSSLVFSYITLFTFFFSARRPPPQSPLFPYTTLFRSRLTAPRGLSRPPTSFIGAWCQGIHRMPQSLGHHRYKMLAHTIHESKHQPQTHLKHNPRKETRRRSSTGVASGNTHPHPPEKPRQGRGLLPQTPNSAPRDLPEASRKSNKLYDHPGNTGADKQHRNRVHFRVRRPIQEKGRLSKTP